MASSSAMVLGLAGTANTVIGQGRQAVAATRQGDYEASIYNQDATLADQQAADAIARGHVAANAAGRETNQTIGAQRAALAGQGVDIADGTAAQIQSDTARFGELDRLTLENNAAREAYGYTTEATNYRQQAQLARQGAQQTAAGIRAGAASTLLTGAANTYGVYQAFHPQAPGVPAANLTVPKPPMGGYNLFRK